MTGDYRATLEAIAYGDGPDVKPADRLRALERLAELDEVRARERIGTLTDEQLAAELDTLNVATLSLLVHEPERVQASYPRTFALLREHVERKAHELSDVARIEAEIERRADERARALAERMYRERAFQVVETPEDGSTGEQEPVSGPEMPEADTSAEIGSERVSELPKSGEAYRREMPSYAAELDTLRRW